MGTWSHEPFGNDGACDWAYGLNESQGLSLIEESIGRVLDIGEDYLEADVAEEAVAAAEVLAKLLGRGTQRDAYTEGVDQWVAAQTLTPSGELLSKAQQALTRILAADSELQELWEDSGECGSWWASRGWALHARPCPLISITGRSRATAAHRVAVCCSAFPLPAACPATGGRTRSSVAGPDR